MILSDKLKLVKPSVTLEITALSKQLKAAGKDIIALSAGEPDFDTPEHIKQAGKQAIDDGQTKYTAVDGTPALKEAIQNKLRQENGLSYELNEICASVGAKQACYNLCQAVLNEGDEAIIPAPYWVSYPDMVLLAGGQPKIISCGIEQNFKITAEQLEPQMNAKTKLLFLNSPSNPTGAIYSEQELLDIAAVLKKWPEVLIASDDIYEHIILNDKTFLNIVNVAPELKDRTIVLNGVSKAYAMTGWRIGFAAGSAEIIAAMRKIQGQSTSNPCAIAQAAATAALSGDQQCIQDMLAAFKERHAYVYQALNALPGVECIYSEGAFYSFADIRGAIKNKGFANDVAFARVLLEESNVAVVPGSGFGLDGYMRLSFASSLETLQQAIGRIEAFLKA